MIYVLIDGVLYTINTADGPASLVPFEGPAPEGATVHEMDALVAETSTIELPALQARVTEARTAFQTLLSTAQTTGLDADMDASEQALIPYLVMSEAADKRIARMNALPDPPADPPPAPPADPNAPPADPPADPNAPADPPVTSVDIDLVVGEDGVVTPVAVLANGVRAPVNWSGGTTFNRDPASLISGAPPANGGGGPAPAPVPAQPRRAARMVAASAFTNGAEEHITVGQDITDAHIAEQFSSYLSNNAGNQSSGLMPAGVKFGSYRIDAPGVNPANTIDLAQSRQIVHANGITNADRARARVQASATGDCPVVPTQRTEIPDCRTMFDPLADEFEEYSAPTCELEYYRELPLVTQGMTVWDDERRKKFCEARDAWYGSIADGEPKAELHAAMLALQKQCYVPGCVPKSKVRMLSIAACMEWPEELEACNEQLISAARRSLQTAFIRERNKYRLAQIDSFSHWVNIDVADPACGFANAAGEQLGAIPVLEEIVQTLTCSGQFNDRTTAGDYTVAIPAGMAKILGWDNRRACHEGREELASLLTSAFEGDATFTIKSMLDLASDETSPFPTPSFPTEENSGLGAANATEYAAWKFGCDYRIRIYDRSDFFALRRPSIGFGAQVTPAYAKSNWVFGMFQETHEGLGKDGCHKAFTINLKNLMWTGARIGCMAPLATCPT